MPLTFRPGAADLSRLSILAEIAARAAGKCALGWFRPGQRTTARIEAKAGGSPVTEADLAVDAQLRTALSGLADAPERYVSEETVAAGQPDLPAAAPAFWLVDPIDGTRAFLAGETEWAISLALVAAGRPLLAVLHAPALGWTLRATAGGGAFLDGVALPPVAAPSGEAILAGPKPLADRFAQRLGGGRVSAKIPSLALRLAAVATGRLHIALASAGAHCWDVAAADLILAEADAGLVDAAGATLTYAPTPRRRGHLVAASQSDLARHAEDLAAIVGPAAGG